MKLLALKFLFIIFSVSILAENISIAVLPFADISKFKGPWKVRREIPKYISKELSKTYNVISFEKVQNTIKSQKLNISSMNNTSDLLKLANILNADILVGAKIEKFNIEKRVLGPAIGGYKHYLGKIESKVNLFSKKSKTIIVTDLINVKIKESNMSLNVMQLSMDENKFDSLRYENFASKRFMETVAGSVLKEFSNKFFDFIYKAPISLAKKGESHKINKSTSKIYEALILAIENKEIYINAGTKQELIAGDTIEVYSNGKNLVDPSTGNIIGNTEKKIGKLTVLIVKSAGFSICTILEGSDKIKEKDKIRIYK